MILGNVKVAVPPDDNPDHGGGPIRVSPNNALPARAGNTIYRSPTTITRDAEPGARWPGDLTKRMFLPDGRLVQANWATRDMMNGSSGLSGLSVGSLAAIVPAIAMFTGAAVGYKFSRGQHEALSTVGGALVGGILGLIFR